MIKDYSVNGIVGQVDHGYVECWSACEGGKRWLRIEGLYRCCGLLKPWASIEKFAMKVYLPTSYPEAWHTILVPVKREIVVTDLEACLRKPIGDGYCTSQYCSG